MNNFIDFVKMDKLGHRLVRVRKLGELTFQKVLSYIDWEVKHLLKLEQVRTNIGLADTLIPSSFLYLIYMGGTGPCDSVKIIFGYHVNS